MKYSNTALYSVVRIYDNVIDNLFTYMLVTYTACINTHVCYCIPICYCLLHGVVCKCRKGAALVQAVYISKTLVSFRNTYYRLHTHITNKMKSWIRIPHHRYIVILFSKVSKTVLSFIIIFFCIVITSTYITVWCCNSCVANHVQERCTSYFHTTMSILTHVLYVIRIRVFTHTVICMHSCR
jgi:hypothetical protein